MSDANVSDEAVEQATGRTWQQWHRHLDAAGAAHMDHADLAKFIGQDSPHLTGWWCQMVAVGYERMTGKRVVGQTSSGGFQTGASKTLAGTMDEWLDAWAHHAEGRVQFNGVAMVDEPRITRTDKWRYWRADLEDGTKIDVVIHQKTPDKAHLAVNHRQLPDQGAVAEWKAYWKEELAKMVE